MFPQFRTSLLPTLLTAAVFSLTAVFAMPVALPEPAYTAVAARQATRADILDRANRVLAPRTVPSPVPVVKCGSATAGVTYVLKTSSGYYKRQSDLAFKADYYKYQATRVRFTSSCHLEDVSDSRVLTVKPNHDTYVEFWPLNAHDTSAHLVCSVTSSNKLSCSNGKETGGRRLQQVYKELVWATDYSSVQVSVEVA